MYAQVAIKPNPLLRNGAYGIVMRGVQKCTCAGASLRGRNSAPLCCIKLDTATDPACGTAGFLVAFAEYIRSHCEDTMTKEQWEHFSGPMFTGFDTDRTMLRLSAMNLMLHSIRTAIRWTTSEGRLRTTAMISPSISTKRWSMCRWSIPLQRKLWLIYTSWKWRLPRGWTNWRGGCEGEVRRCLYCCFWYNSKKRSAGILGW